MNRVPRPCDATKPAGQARRNPEPARHHEDDQRAHRQRIDGALEQHGDDEAWVESLSPAEHGHRDGEGDRHDRRVAEVGRRREPEVPEQQDGEKVGTVQDRQREQDADLVDEEQGEDQHQAGQEVAGIGAPALGGHAGVSAPGELGVR